MEEVLQNKKRVRDESEDASPEVDLPEVKRLKENLLDTLEDDAEFCDNMGQDLDSFMKSFEEEITASPSAGAGAPATAVVDSESRPELGYLFEASDDELGLPPATSPEGAAETELDRAGSVSSDLGSGFWEIPSYDDDPFGFGFGGAENNEGGNSSEYAELDGLFDYSDMGFGSSEIGWRPETLPAQ